MRTVAVKKEGIADEAGPMMDGKFVLFLFFRSFRDVLLYLLPEKEKKRKRKNSFPDQGTRGVAISCARRKIE